MLLYFYLSLLAFEFRSLWSCVNGSTPLCDTVNEGYIYSCKCCSAVEIR